MRFLLTILAALLLAYGLSFYLTVPANPEVVFWRKVTERRDQDIAMIRKHQPGSPIIFFTGGSSCAFSIDPRIIEEATGLPAINLGLPVACGRQYILHQALSRCQKGDILIICLEPDLITYPDTSPIPAKLSFALAASQGSPLESAGYGTFGNSFSGGDWLSSFRPGARYLVILVGRTIGGKGYRYQPEDVRYRGRTETPIKAKNLEPSEDNRAVSLNAEGRQFLKTFAKSARQKGVRVAYSLPWRLTHESSLNHNRANHRKLLADIESIMPTLEDGTSGSVSDPSIYSDSAWHLTVEGSAKRSDAIAVPLKQWLEN